MALNPHAQRFLSMLAAGGQGGGVSSIMDRRAALSDLAALADAPPETTAIIVADAVIAGSGPDIPIRIYRSAAAARIGPGVIYLHGGGWTGGGLDTHDGVCRALAEASGYPVIAVDYRLAPEHPFPAGLDDADAVVRAVADAPERFRVDSARLILAGDSAGGTLAAALCGRYADGGGPAIARLLLICPILDMAAEAPSRIAFGEGHFLSRGAVADDLNAYLAHGPSAEDPRISPLRRADLFALPPVELHVAESDPFRDEGLAYAERLAAAGVPVRTTVHPGMIHYFYALSRAIPYARGALATIGADLRKAMG